jgi:hypothetical protein
MNPHDRKQRNHGRGNPSAWMANRDGPNCLGPSLFERF